MLHTSQETKSKENSTPFRNSVNCLVLKITSWMKISLKKSSHKGSNVHKTIFSELTSKICDGNARDNEAKGDFLSSSEIGKNIEL